MPKINPQSFAAADGVLRVQLKSGLVAPALRIHLLCDMVLHLPDSEDVFRISSFTFMVLWRTIECSPRLVEEVKFICTLVSNDLLHEQRGLCPLTH